MKAGPCGHAKVLVFAPTERAAATAIDRHGGKPMPVRIKIESAKRGAARAPALRSLPHLIGRASIVASASAARTRSSPYARQKSVKAARLRVTLAALAGPTPAQILSSVCWARVGNPRRVGKDVRKLVIHRRREHSRKPIKSRDRSGW